MKVTRCGIADAMDIVAALGGAVNPFSAPDAGERGDGGAFAAMLGACPRWLCSHAPVLTVDAALLAVASLRLLGGFAGNGRRFRHGSWTSMRFSAGLFAVGFADLGKRRRWVAFRAGSACETVQKL